MENRVKRSIKRSTRRSSGSKFDFAPIFKPRPKQPQKSLGREVFELLLETVSPDTLKVRRFTESLATSPKLSKRAQAVWKDAGTIVDMVGFLKLLNTIAPSEPDRH
jgi:hypothetical protein